MSVRVVLAGLLGLVTVLATASTSPATSHVAGETPMTLDLGLTALAPSTFTASPFASTFVTTGSEGGLGAEHYVPSNGDGTFGARSDIGGLGSVDGTDVADMDSDGDLDFLMCEGNGNVTLYRNQGGGTFEPTSVASGITSEFCTNLRIADFNGDGRNDFVVGDNRNVNGTKVFLQTATGTFSVSQTLDTSWTDTNNNNLFGIATGDLNGDGHVDILMLGYFGTGAGQVRFYAGAGTGQFAAPTSLFNVNSDFGVNGNTGLAVLDLDRDGDLDIVVGGAASGTTTDERGQHFIYKNNGNGTFTKPSGPAFDVNAQTGADAFDFDGDGWTDLVVVTFNPTGEEVPGTLLYLRNVEGTLAAPVEVASLGGASIGVGAPPDLFVANHPPVAVNDTAIADEDTAVDIDVIVNDTDPDGDALSVASIANVVGGTAVLQDDGRTVRFTPASNANDANTPSGFSFTYRATDGAATSASEATVTITVNAVNDGPAAANDAYSTNEDSGLTVATPGVLGNDTDADSANLTAILVTTTTHGTLTLNANGSFTYTPNGNFNGSDSFTYKANDGSLDSNVATVTITVTPVNDRPILSAADQTGTEGNLLTFQVSATDTDGDPLSFSAGSLPSGASFDAATRTFSWTPNFAQGGSSPYFVEFTVSDGQLSDVKVVSITITDVVATVDSDNDGVPDDQDNCPDDANSTQLDVCHTSPEPVAGSATAIAPDPASVDGPLFITVNITVTTGDAPASFVVPDLFTGTVICQVVDNATGARIPFERIAEMGFVVMNEDGDLVTVPAGETRTIEGRPFDVRLTNPSLGEGSYTFECTYRNRVPRPPDSEAGVTDPDVWTGERPATTTTAYLGSYAFSGFLPPLRTTRDVRGSVPVKFSLRNDAGVFIATCTCALLVQPLTEAGVPSGDPFPATPTGNSTSNLFRYDSENNQYVFNLSTDGLPNGRYRLIARLDNGTEQTVDIRVRH